MIYVSIFSSKLPPGSYIIITLILQSFKQYPLESTPKTKRIRKELPAPIVVDTDSDSSVLCYYPECSPSAIHICGDLATFDNSVTFDESADTSVLVYTLTESKSELDSPVLFYNPNARLKRRMIHPYWSTLQMQAKRRTRRL